MSALYEIEPPEQGVSADPEVSGGLRHALAGRYRMGDDNLPYEHERKKVTFALFQPGKSIRARALVR